MNFVDWSRLQLALREIRAHFTNPRLLASVTIVGLLLGIAGPFDTSSILPLAQRLAYWLAVAGLTYFVGFATSRVVLHLFGLSIRRIWLRVLVFGTITGVPITLVVLALNLIAFGANWQDAIAPLTLYIDVTLASIGIAAVAEIISASLRPVQNAPSPGTVVGSSPAPPAILERLPLPLRGQLWALVVSDHYVEVWTERGTHLVLMRLSDAIRETAGENGLQIHRSHWVALGAVKRTLKADGKPMVELPDGRRLPISRTYLEAARSAGLA
jgi:hypothetical protein